MAQLFAIEDNTVVITNATLTNTQGSLTHTGDLTLAGFAKIENDLTVAGAITADTVIVKNLITESGAVEGLGSWSADTEAELNGKGINWTWHGGSAQLQYRTGGRLWASTGYDTAADQSYKIDGVPVLAGTSLGDTVIHSKLKTIGTLNSLAVIGDTKLGDFVYIDSTTNRLGIGTDEPSTSVTILDNNVEIGIGSPSANTAGIGSNSSHDFTINTNKQARITVKADGEVHIGNEISKQSVLRVFGSIYVDNLVADTRVNRSTPLQFNATRDQSIYGLGLQWAGTGAQRELAMYADPDRLHTTENFDLADGRSYHINGKPVLTQNSLGSGIGFSHLTTVGTLQSLDVMGIANFQSSIQAITISVSSEDHSVVVNNKGLASDKSVAVSAAGFEAVYADANEINLGDRQNTRRPIKVFGPMSVGVTSLDPDTIFAVNGNVNLGGKKFTNGVTYPTSGHWTQGDICWNSQPQATGYIGWVCLQTGEPGAWSPFGLIA